MIFWSKNTRIDQKSQKNFLFYFLVNPFSAELIEKQVIFSTVFAIIRTNAQFSTVVVPRNFVFTLETLKQIGFQKIWLHWFSENCLSTIFVVKVKNVQKVPPKNQHTTKL